MGEQRCDRGTALDVLVGRLVEAQASVHAVLPPHPSEAAHGGIKRGSKDNPYLAAS